MNSDTTTEDGPGQQRRASEAFAAALERPAVFKPRLSALLSEPSPFSDESG